MDTITQAIREAGTSCCVGIDPHMGKLPTDSITIWGIGVIEAVYDAGIRIVKPQSALFEQYGSAGHHALSEIVQHAHRRDMAVILDAKRGDIGSTAEAYVRATIHPDGPLNVDAVTVNPYLGPESLEPFAIACERYGKGMFVLVRTSNPGAELWQVQGMPRGSAKPAYAIAKWVEERSAFCGAVVGGTLDAWEITNLRRYMATTTFLVPGYGAQGAAAESLRACLRPHEGPLPGGVVPGNGHGGAVVSSSRGVLFGENDGKLWQERVHERAKTFISDVAQITARNEP